MVPYGQNPPGGGRGSGGGSDLTVGDYANGMPNIRLSEIPASFARQIKWMLPAILILLVASWPICGGWSDFGAAWQ